MPFQLTIVPTAGDGNQPYAVTVTPLDGAAHTVNMSASLSPPGGAAIAPGTVLLLQGGAAVNAQCGVGVVIQHSTLTVTGAEGGVVRTCTATINAADFSMAFTTSPGTGNSTYVVRFTSLNRFAGNVSVTASLNVSGSIGYSPSTVSLAANGFADLSCSVGTVIQDGTLTVTGTFTQGGQTITHSVTAAIAAGRFDIRVPPNIPVANVNNINVRAISQNGFAGTVQLTAVRNPANGIAMVSPSSVAVPNGGQVNSNGMAPGAAAGSTFKATGTYTQGGVTITADDTGTVV